MAITLQEIATEIQIQEPNAVVSYFPQYDDYLDVWTPKLRFNIYFGNVYEGGWSYNDSEGYGYSNYIPELSSVQEIVTEFFNQLSNDTNLTYAETN